MIKNDITYEYRVFTNRLVDIDSMEVGRCTNSVLNKLKPKDKVNGRFYHTSDTDEWFFCWNGEMQKLNLKGDADVNAALEQVKKLISEANAAVSDAKSTAKEAKTAADEAQVAAESATKAVESIGNKADKSEVATLEQKVLTKADQSVVDGLLQTVDTKADQSVVDGLLQTIQAKADQSVVDDLSQTVGTKADKTVVQELSNKFDAIKLDDYALKSDVPSLNGYATETFVNGKIGEIKVPNKVSDLVNDKNYLTEHQDISGKQDVIEDLEDIRNKANNALTEVPAEYITETELGEKGYLTSQSLEGYAKTEDIPSLENVALKSDLPIMGNYYTKEEIDDLIGVAINITNTILG